MPQIMRIFFAAIFAIFAAFATNSRHSHQLMFEVKKIAKLSLANIAALLYALFGFIATFAALVYGFIKVILEKETAGKLVQYIFINLGVDFLFSLGVAIIAGAIGWLVWFAASGFYNFIAKNIGGIKIELADESSFATATEDKAALIKTSEGKSMDKNNKQELFKY
jgi:hypothetical protein